VESAALLVDDILPEVPIRQWVVSFPHALRFLFATRPAVMGEVLGIVYRVIATHLVKKAGETLGTASTGAVTLIQRFGSALNLNIHFHMLFLDGVYVEARERLRFRRVKAPERAELEALVQSVSERVGRHLERQGLLVRDAENGYLELEPEGEDALAPVLGSSITYRIALGPHQGRKAFTLRTLAPDPWGEEPSARVAQASGFSLHAGVLAEAGEREKLERLCRYIARPAVATRRLSLTAQGQVRYQLKTPYRDGTTHVLFEPVDCMAHIPVRHPSGDLRSCQSALLPIGHRSAGGAGAEAPGEPHPLSWDIRAEQPRARAGHPGPARAATPGEGAPQRGRAPGGDDLGAAPATGLPYRPRDLRRLWRAGAGDCQH